jgi:hypothetical protein
MLRPQLKDFGHAAPRFGAFLAIGLLALALSGCAMLHRAKPGSATGDEVKNAPGAHDPYPHLGEVPDRPKPAETADTRREIARGLVADRDSAHYSDQALRGGTEASAPPPPAPVQGLARVSDDEANTGALDSAKDKTKSAAAADDKPSFFGRLFGHKAKPADSDQPAPLPAQPTPPVEVKPVQ